MRLISHRGNTIGPNPEMENSPLYIQETLDKGFDVEIDLSFWDWIAFRELTINMF
jgi:hypothetical protein